MKGLILSGFVFFLLLCASSLALRFYRGSKEFRVLLVVLGFSIGLYGLCYLWLPHDLGFLHDGALEPNRSVDFWNGVLVLLMLFHGFWVFLYVSGVGPSMGMMLEVRARRSVGMAEEEALKKYGHDRPRSAILERRLKKLVEGRYVAEQDGEYRLLPRGARVASLAIFLRRVLNIRGGG